MPRQNMGLEEESALATLERHCVEFRERIAEQEWRIFRLESRGRPSKEARALLAVLRKSLELARARLQHRQWQARLASRPARGRYPGF